MPASAIDLNTTGCIRKNTTSFEPSKGGLEIPAVDVKAGRTANENLRDYLRNKIDDNSSVGSSAKFVQDPLSDGKNSRRPIVPII